MIQKEKVVFLNRTLWQVVVTVCILSISLSAAGADWPPTTRKSARVFGMHSGPRPRRESSVVKHLSSSGAETGCIIYWRTYFVGRPGGIVP